VLKNDLKSKQGECWLQNYNRTQKWFTLYKQRNNIYYRALKPTKLKIAIRNILATLEHSLSKYLNNIYPPLKTTVRTKIFPARLR